MQIWARGHLLGLQREGSHNCMLLPSDSPAAVSRIPMSSLDLGGSS